MQLLIQTCNIIQIKQHKRKAYVPREQSSWGKHGAQLGPVSPRWAPCWPHEPCYLVIFHWAFCISKQKVPMSTVYLLWKASHCKLLTFCSYTWSNADFEIRKLWRIHNWKLETEKYNKNYLKIAIWQPFHSCTELLSIMISKRQLWFAFQYNLNYNHITMYKMTEKQPQ